jgi:hypothetical protein
MREQPFKLITSDGISVVHRHWGDGFIIIGRALAQPDGEKIVEELNRLTSIVNAQKTSLRDEILRDVTEAIEGNFMDID